LDRNWRVGAINAVPERLLFALAGLQDLALIVEDRDTAEALLRLIGVLELLCRVHAADERGRCRRCRPVRRSWRTARRCTVHDAFASQGLTPFPQVEQLRGDEPDVGPR
jgi:hypothetical protein